MNKLIQGTVVKLSKHFTIGEVRAFSQISTDTNPIHLDEQVGKNSIFGQRVVHGMLTASLFGGIIGTHLPGAIYLEQNLKFVAPVYIDEEVTASVELKEVLKKKDKNILKLETIVKKGDIIAINGTATVLF